LERRGGREGEVVERNMSWWIRRDKARKKKKKKKEVGKERGGEE